MEWIDKRKLFDPIENQNFEVGDVFAQSPQTVVFDDFVRIYFSTRKRESSGKYLSYIAFIDMDKSFNTILNYTTKEVIPLGDLGTFDEHGIFPINLLKEDNKVLAYTCGWSRRVSVSVETSIGLAISNDEGQTFQKYGHGPVVSSSLKEPVLVGDAFVKKFNGIYHMWYIFGQKWIEATQNEPEARVYKIAHATSFDGIKWNKEEGIPIISDVLNENECQALPTVIKIGERYHMYFCFREATDFRANPKRGYQLGYAYSDDLKNWIRDDAKFIIPSGTDDWDSEMRCYPHILECDSKVYLLYNGNEFGKHGFGIVQLSKDFINQQLSYKVDKAQTPVILNHLKACDKQFVPFLSERIDLNLYAQKLNKLAMTFEAWDFKLLVGLIAVYFNEDNKSAFITNVSVMENYSRNGIATELMERTKTYARANNYESISLEVNKSNSSAISFYKKHNFDTLSDNKDVLIMIYHLKQ